MTVPAPGWRPLPDCTQCGRPTRRSTHQRLGGYCSECKRVEHPALAAERTRLQEWQGTVRRIRGQENARIEALRLRREARKRRDGQ